MRWEGAAKRSEGSRAWGCKHCRGREGIWRNRSQRWVVTVLANHSPPLPCQWGVCLSRVLRSHESDQRWLAVPFPAAAASLFVVLNLKLNLMLYWDHEHVLLVTGEERCKSLWCVCGLRRLYFASCVEFFRVDFVVSAWTGWISHLNEHLQRETNGPTSLYCLFNKRDKVTDNLPL